MSKVEERLDILKDVIVSEHEDMVKNYSDIMSDTIISYRIYNNIVEWLYGNSEKFPLCISSKRAKEILEKYDIK